RMELDGLRDTPRRALQKCGQLFQYAAGLGAAERDITRDLAGYSSACRPNTTPGSRIRGGSDRYCDRSIASIRRLPWEWLCGSARSYSCGRLNSLPPNGTTLISTPPSGASPPSA